MKILIVASAAASLINFRSQLILDFIAQGYEVNACAPNLSDDHKTLDWLTVQGVVCHDAPFSRAGLNPLNDALALLKLKQLIANIRPDIFLGYTIKPVIWGGIAARLSGVPKRVALITGLGYAFTGEASGKRKLIQLIVRKLYRLSLTGMHQVFFQNPDDKHYFVKLGVVPPNVPIEVVNGSGIDLKLYKETPLPSEPLKFLLIARLLGDKGIREYAFAAAEIKLNFPEVEFHLVGGLDSNPNGLKETEIQEWVKQGQIIWHGEQSDVRPFIANCHVYVLPSYREGTPRSVLEAMAMGRPIITTDAPGCRETVITDYNGHLVPPQSVKSLVETMRGIITEPSKIVLMGKNSRKLAESKYDVHKVNEFMLSVILGGSGKIL